MQTLTVTSGTAVGTTTATAVHGAANKVVVHSGNNQTGINSTTLANPLIARVNDNFGNPVHGAEVSFSITSGSGTLAPSSSQTTDANGLAQTYLTLGSEGVINVTAKVSGLTSAVFTENSIIGGANHLVLVSGGGQNAIVGTALTNPIVVRAEDNYNNPVDNVTLHFAPKATSGVLGSAGASDVVTDASGQASTTFTLGQLAGDTTQWVEVTVNGFPSVTTLNVTVEADPDEPADITIVSGNTPTQLASYGQTLPLPLVVYVEDQYANPVWDYVVTWSSTTGTPGDASTITGANGQTSTMGTLGSTPGVLNQYFTATAGTVDVTFSATATGHYIKYSFPGRTWPESPFDIETEIHGGGFDADAIVVWDVGGVEQSILPTLIEDDRILLSLEATLFSSEGVVPITVEQTDGGRCDSFEFVVGGSVPDTGQIYCYDDRVQIPCPSEPETFYGQDAQLGWDLYVTPAQRFDRTVPVIDQPVIHDRISRLEWQGCVAGLSGSNCTDGWHSSMNWFESTGVEDEDYNPGGAEDYCGELLWGGYNDWRLPSVRELVTIINIESTGGINSVFFPNTPMIPFWSASYAAFNLEGAWAVTHNIEDSNSLLSPWQKSVETLGARCVRNPSGTSDRVLLEVDVVSGDRVVRQIDTGLMWQGCTSGLSGEICMVGAAEEMIWKDALDYCANLSIAGYTDWRLPSFIELQNIIEYTSFTPAVDEVAFPGTLTSMYWSSSTSPVELDAAIAVHFNDGEIVNTYSMAAKEYSQQCCRCVRNGP